MEQVLPWEVLGETTTPDGTLLSLTRRGGEYVILAGGKGLMSNRMHGSEEALATLGCAPFRERESPHVLIGGLGMGYTLRATLDALGSNATVTVAELLATVVEWNRGPIGHLAGHPLKDKRVALDVRNVLETLRMNERRFDAILLDVDNGPRAFTEAANAGLYSDGGIAAARDALATDGVLAVWSAWDDKKYEHRLRYAGFTVDVVHVRARLDKGGPPHTIFLAHQRSTPLKRIEFRY